MDAIHLEQIITGLSIGSILLLVALGLSIIYGSMGVINLAHGEFVMLGAYTRLGVPDLISASACSQAWCRSFSSSRLSAGSSSATSSEHL